jgi:hypothetical protein
VKFFFVFIESLLFAGLSGSSGSFNFLECSLPRWHYQGQLAALGRELILRHCMRVSDSCLFLRLSQSPQQYEELAGPKTV